MLSKWVFLIVLIACLGGNCCVPLPAQDFEFDSARVIESTNARRRVAKCVHYKVSGETTWHGGSGTVISKDRKSGAGFPREDITRPFKAEALIDFENGRFQLEKESIAVWDTVGVVPKHNFVVYENGKLVRHNKAAQQLKRDGIALQADFERLPLRHIAIEPEFISFFVTHGYVPITHGLEHNDVFNHRFTPDNFSIHATKEINDSECVTALIEVAREDAAPSRRQFCFDPESEYDVVQVSFFGFKREARITIEYADHIPIKSVCQIYNDDKLKITTKFELEKFILNPDYEATRREFEFVPDMEYIDSVTYTFYRVNENLELIRTVVMPNISIVDKSTEYRANDDLFVIIPADETIDIRGMVITAEGESPPTTNVRLKSVSGEVLQSTVLKFNSEEDTRNGFSYVGELTAPNDLGEYELVFQLDKFQLNGTMSVIAPDDDE